MKKTILKNITVVAVAILTTLGAASCKKETTSGTKLIDKGEVTLGNGDGKATYPTYLGFTGNGQIQTWMSVSTSDEATQAKVDLTFPSVTNPIICGPSEGDFYSGYNCVGWSRRKSCAIKYLGSGFDKTAFNNVTTVEQVKQKFDDGISNNWLTYSQGSALAIKTFDGVYAIVYVNETNGSGNSDDHAYLKLLIKVQP